jgi:quercetin dioxygenase-like cupin family protein
MHLIRARSGRPSVRRTDTFTGEVWADPVSAPGEDPMANTVAFAPGARTFWHRHEGGQLIIATHGSGFVVREDGSGGPIVAGQSVWTPAGEVHWHGAGPDSLLTHTAYSFGSAEWLDEVSEQEYLEGIRATW